MDNYDIFTPIKKEYKGKAYNGRTYTDAFSHFWTKANEVEGSFNSSISNTEDKVGVKYSLSGKTIRHKHAHVHTSRKNCSCDHGAWYHTYQIKLNSKRDTEKMLKSFKIDYD